MAIVYVVAWSAPFYIDASADGNSALSDPSELAETVALAFFGALTLLTGVIVRWPALVLPFVIYGLLLPLGINPEDSDGWTYAWLYAIPAGIFSLPVLAAGALGGTITQFLLRRRSA